MVSSAQANSLAQEPAQGLGRTGRYGAQVQPLQEGSLQVSLEVEEEAHSTPAKEETQDEATIKVREEGAFW